MLAAPFDEAGDGDVVGFLRFDFEPTVILTKNQSLVAEVVDALELIADLVRRGVNEHTPMKAGIEKIEAEQMLWRNGGGVRPRAPCLDRDEGVAEIIDEHLTVARLARLPRRQVK